MPKKVQVRDLLFVSKALKSRLDDLAAGASLAARTGLDVNKIRLKAANDRAMLAAAFLKEAKYVAANGGMNRTVVSRAYYAMYHAARAITFLSYGGDDHQEHSTLPGKLPRDFPESAQWQNALKNARLERNKADYDPYPRSDADFGAAALALLLEAKLLVTAAKAYIRSKS